MTPTTMGALEQGKRMGWAMMEAALDAHGSMSLPAADVAMEFCARVEYDEPGTYPDFAAISRTAMHEAHRVYNWLKGRM